MTLSASQSSIRTAVLTACVACLCPAAFADSPPEGTAHLAGTFNGWNTNDPAYALTPGASGHEELVIDWPRGRYQFKFTFGGTWDRHWGQGSGGSLTQPGDNITLIVSHRGKWKLWLDRTAARWGFESLAAPGEVASKFGPAQPGKIVRAAVRHDPRRPDDYEPVSSDLVDLRVRTLAKDVASVSVRPPGDVPPVSMRQSDSYDGFDFWTARVRRSTVSEGYSIVIRDADDELVLKADPHSGAGQSSQPTRLRSGPDFATPDWAKSAVWYQIFPERFRNADHANDPPRTVPWTHSWYKPYKPDLQKPDKSTAFSAGYEEKGPTFYSYIYDRRYGGDVQGIREKLPYLRNLGVNAIYLNPCFQAESLHKYDTADYRHIDDFFGARDSRLKLDEDPLDPSTWKWSDSDRIFLDFLRDAHRQGFRVILDGVFNHVGREFWAFQDVLKNKQKSRFADWFDIKSWDPFHYYGWFGEDNALPRLKHSDSLGLAEPVRQHIFAITRRWMDPDADGNPSDGIDGWRLDVAPDINAHFWRDWRKLVKSINPDAYICAEIWNEARHMLQGDQFDAVMNYEFAKPCQRFFVNQKQAIKPTEFDAELRTARDWYAPQVNLVLQNLFDSHDTDRVASMLMNPDLEYDAANRLQDNGPRYNPARPTPECYRKLKLMVAFQMTYLGAPMIWYGDEVGMFGADDPSCRKPMLWPDLMPFDDPDEKIMPDVFEHYRRMIAIRNSYPALQLGAFDTVLTDDGRGLFAFARTLGDETILVVLNNSDSPQRVDVPVAWPDKTPILRLDDPAACTVVDAPAARPAARPKVRPAEHAVPRLSVTKGMIPALDLAPRSAAVLAKVHG